MVFEPFFRLARDEHSGIEGNGLGLAICRELVTQLHGEITLSSVGGEGTIRHRPLPDAEVARPARPPRTCVPTVGAVRIQAGSRRCLPERPDGHSTDLRASESPVRAGDRGPSQRTGVVGVVVQVVIDAEAGPIGVAAGARRGLWRAQACPHRRPDRSGVAGVNWPGIRANGALRRLRFDWPAGSVLDAPAVVRGVHRAVAVVGRGPLGRDPAHGRAAGCGHRPAGPSARRCPAPAGPGDPPSRGSRGGAWPRRRFIWAFSYSRWPRLVFIWPTVGPPERNVDRPEQPETIVSPAQARAARTARVRPACDGRAARASPASVAARGEFANRWLHWFQATRCVPRSH